MRRFFMGIVVMAALGVSVRTQTADFFDSDIVRQVLREVAEVKGGTTPAQWLQAHTDEKLQMFNGPQYANDTQRWCARMVEPHPSTIGRAWTHSVYFYDPQPPADDTLPAPGTSGRELLETTCQLGLMWIDVPESNPVVGTKLTEDIQAALASRYGAGSTPRLGPSGFGAAGWTDSREWNLDGAVLTVAYDQFRGKSHRVLVRLAFANSDAIHDLGKETGHTRVNLVAERDELVRKVKEAGMPAPATTEMIALLDKPDYFSGQNRPSDTAVVAAFHDWLTAAKSQPAAQQAVALLAADRVLDFVGHNGVLMEEAARAAMKRLGADYVHDELAGSDVYAHGLLKQAKALATSGPSADEILLFQ